MSPYFTQTFARAFGTWPLKGDTLRGALEAALDVGYRAIDTAQMYANEAETGEVIAASDIARDDLLVTTKVHPDNYTDAAFLKSVETSARHLGRIDVLLLHWPPADGDVRPPLRLLESALSEGLTRHIGVSNFNSAMLRVAKEQVQADIAINQVEFHPFLDQSRLLAAAADLGIPLSAYCSVARGRVFDDPTLAKIGAAHGKGPGQIALRWILQKGVALTTMSTKRANLEANFDLTDFTLTDQDMARIDALGSADGRIVGSNVVAWAPDWD